MTRDSIVWQILFYVGAVATALAALTDPTTYGIPPEWMPYIRLAALIAAIVGGKLGLSWLPKAAPGEASGLGTGNGKSSLLIAVIGLGFTLGTIGTGGMLLSACHAATPRHDTVVNLSVLTKAIGGLQDEITIACKAGALQPATCRSSGDVFVKVWTLDNDAIVAVRSWKPGTPAPQVVRDEASALKALVADLQKVAGLPPTVAAKILIVYDAIATVLLVFVGGA